MPHKVKITTEIDNEIFLKLKLFSELEDTPLYNLINEALATWMKWNRKDEMEDRLRAKKMDPGELQDYQKEILATQRLVEEVRRERIRMAFERDKKAHELDGRKNYRRGPYKRKKNHNQGTDKKVVASYTEDATG
jgi:hypothetical protein